MFGLVLYQFELNETAFSGRTNEVPPFPFQFYPKLSVRQHMMLEEKNGLYLFAFFITSKSELAISYFVVFMRDPKQ